jgi:hypothetical protein
MSQEFLERLADTIAQFTVIGNPDPAQLAAGEYVAELTDETLIAAIDVLGRRSWALSVILANIELSELGPLMDRCRTEQLQRLHDVIDGFEPDRAAVSLCDHPEFEAVVEVMRIEDKGRFCGEWS